MANGARSARPSELRWASVVVLFNPDSEAIESVLRLAGSGYSPVAVVNSATAEQVATLRAAPLARLILNHANEGLARALNQGIEAALASGADYIMLLDQDSRPGPNMGHDLVASAAAAAARGERVGCVGPVLLDRKGTLPIHMESKATYEVLAARETIATSGAVFPATALRAIGPMWEPLFIDGIDHEWCWRARSLGYVVAVAPDVTMLHDMGDLGVTLFGRYRPIHRSPFRHFHIVRNTLWLARQRHIGRRWRFKEMVKLIYRMPVYAAVSSDRWQTFRQIGRALYLGVRPPKMPSSSGIAE